jgi:formate dehydrogenase iron-sulfur subunit
MSGAISPGTAYGFFTDTSICIGCKACEVACKEWNQLPGNPPRFLGDSFDNTGQLDGMNWRHVQFHETTTSSGGPAWLMMSDVCKHCNQASCMDVCPTGAIIRTEFDTVFIQQDVCNGCRNCISACPFGVIGFSGDTGTVRKCTLCYDRLQAGMQPACAQACPTQSIRFGPLVELHARADTRLVALQSQGHDPILYGRDDRVYGGLGAFFLLMDKPETYGLPDEASAVRPTRNTLPGSLGAVVASVLAVVGGLIAFRRRQETAGGTR